MDISQCTSVDLGRGGYRIYQNRDGFRFGTDTVLLAWFTAAFIREGNPLRALELGAGNGAASILVKARRPAVRIDAVEIDEAAKSLMEINIRENGLEEAISVYEGDVRDMPSSIRRYQYDLCFMNPPFFREKGGPSADPDKPGRLKGRFEMNGTLEDFIRAGSARLIPSAGIMTIVMTPERLDETIILMERYNIRVSSLLAVHPFADREAGMFLIEGRKTVSDLKMRMLPPLIINEKDAESGNVRQTQRIMKIYGEEHTDCFI